MNTFFPCRLKVLTKFLKNPKNCLATSFSSVAVGCPCEKPVPTGCSTHTMFVRFVHDHGLGTGFSVPYCQRKGPFSCSSPSRELQPGPPFSQIVISSEATGFSDGKNQKYSSWVSFRAWEIGSKPAYDSPMSKSTSGMPVPLTANSVRSVRRLHPTTCS